MAEIRKLTLSAFVLCFAGLLLMFFTRGRRLLHRPAPRVLLNNTQLSREFLNSYTYVYTNPRTGIRGDPMFFYDEKSLSHIRQVESIRAVNATDYVDKLPQVVTYSSENHWSQTDSHLPTILDKFDNVVIYSMGLKPETIETAKSKYGEDKIKFIHFDSSQYPPHMHNLKVYAFKGAIWADAIARFGWCLFLDASVFLKGDVMVGLKNSMFRKDGNEVCFKYVISDAGHDIFMATRANLYDYFPVEATEFNELHEFRDVGQQQSGGFSVLPTQECLNNFVKPVLMCSLFKDCIALPGATLTGKTRHRYDQSIAHTLVGNMYTFNKFQNVKNSTLSSKEYITLKRDLAAIVCRAAFGCPTEQFRQLCGEHDGPLKGGFLKQNCVQ